MHTQEGDSSYICRPPPIGAIATPRCLRRLAVAYTVGHSTLGLNTLTFLDDLGALVAVGAAFVAALSALYARWQAKAARRANEISIHDKRLNVYSALVRFRVHLTGHGANIKDEEVWRFAEAIEASEFYFPPRVHPRMEYALNESFRLMSLQEEWRAARETEPERAPSLVKPKLDLSRDLRDECERIANELKPYLRVGEA